MRAGRIRDARRRTLAWPSRRTDGLPRPRPAGDDGGGTARAFTTTQYGNLDSPSHDAGGRAQQAASARVRARLYLSSVQSRPERPVCWERADRLAPKITPGALLLLVRAWPSIPGRPPRSASRSRECAHMGPVRVGGGAPDYRHSRAPAQQPCNLFTTEPRMIMTALIEAFEFCPVRAHD